MSDPKECSAWNEEYAWREIHKIDPSLKPNQPGLRGYARRSKKSFERIVAEWDQTAHTEWLVREYLALKLIMDATIQLGAAQFSADRNLRISVPYLTYYGLFNAMRAAVLTSPATTWGKQTFTAGHRNVEQAFEKELRCLVSEKVLTETLDLVDTARAGRELQSYRFPSEGAPGRDGMYVYTDEATRVATLAAELAVFNSWCLAAAVERRYRCVDGWNGYEAESALLDLTWQHDVNARGGIIIDNEDWRYVKRMGENIRVPMSMLYLIGEGGIETFFDAYAASDELGVRDQFDGDDYWNVLLDLP